MIIFDTNVISERFRESPDKRVSEWLGSVDRDETAMTTVTIAELLLGAALMPQGRRRMEVETRIDLVIGETFRGRIEAFDHEAANAFPSVIVERRRIGRPIAFQDAQIAAICLSRGATLATRNIKDFEGLGVKLIDPWEY